AHAVVKWLAVAGVCVVRRMLAVAFARVRWACVLACALALLGGAVAHAAPTRVLLVFGKNVSDEARQAVESAVSADAEAVDAREYERAAREKGLLPQSDATLERVAPRQNAQLIIVATKAGGKLALTYRDGSTGEVMRKDSVPERHRGAAAARVQARVGASVRKSLRGVAATSGSALSVEPEPIEDSPDDETGAGSEDSITPEPEPEPELEDDEAPADSAQRFIFELSAGLGGAMRQATLPTRLGVNELDTGMFTGIALGLRMTAPVGSQFLVRASADYRTSLGLRGKEMQRATEMSTELRSHSLGFGIAPGYRFGAADSVRLLMHVGWYFRGLRPIAQLALPEVSWHAAVFRPELEIPFADGAVTLRLAPELLIIAGLYTTLPDESGLAHTGLGFGGEASLDVRLATPIALRVEYRESHATFRTAWAQNLSDVERFATIGVVLIY
ncbi:MAG TPA: hypothetical protein VMF89_23900, partial [Polyangiales bacterium]|nr:hypothetical protein [Polyangiales bacterium]